jgi:hypothetical protein
MTSSGWAKNTPLHDNILTLHFVIIGLGSVIPARCTVVAVILAVQGRFSGLSVVQKIRDDGLSIWYVQHQMSRKSPRTFDSGSRFFKE